MSENRELERVAEQCVEAIETANRDVANLIEILQQITEFAETVDTVDLRDAFALKSDMSKLQREMDDLDSNVRTLARELSDTESAIRKAMY